MLFITNKFIQFDDLPRKDIYIERSIYYKRISCVNMYIYSYLYGYISIRTMYTLSCENTTKGKHKLLSVYQYPPKPKTIICLACIAMAKIFLFYKQYNIIFSGNLAFLFVLKLWQFTVLSCNFGIVYLLQFCIVGNYQ